MVVTQRLMDRRPDLMDLLKAEIPGFIQDCHQTLQKELNIDGLLPPAFQAPPTLENTLGGAVEQPNLLNTATPRMFNSAQDNYPFPEGSSLSSSSAMHEGWQAVSDLSTNDIAPHIIDASSQINSVFLDFSEDFDWNKIVRPADS